MWSIQDGIKGFKQIETEYDQVILIIKRNSALKLGKCINLKLEKNKIRQNFMYELGTLTSDFYLVCEIITQLFYMIKRLSKWIF